MKSKRLEAVLNIIDNEDIFTQEDLLKSLRSKGFDVTQATVSRDIKALDLVKVTTNDGKYKYKQQDNIKSKKSEEKFRSVFSEVVIDVDYAQNISVLKCHVGMGNAACAALDIMEISDIVGTLAGDDTVFVLLRDEKKASEFCDKINKILER